MFIIIKIEQKTVNYFFYGFVLDEKNGIESKEIIMNNKNKSENNHIHSDGSMIRVKSVASLHNNDTSHTHIYTHTDNNNHNNNSLQNNNSNNNNNNSNNDYNNDKKIINMNNKTGNESSKNRSSPSGSPKLLKPIISYNTTSSTSSTSFPPYSSSTWPSSHTHSVMACFSHASSLDAFIISAVIPVWNHALVSTKHVCTYTRTLLYLQSYVCSVHLSHLRFLSHFHS